MTNRELIDIYMQSKEKKEEFSIILCKFLNNEIQKFWEENPEKNEIYIYIFYDENDDGIKYKIELVKDLYPETLCIHLLHDQSILGEKIEIKK